MQEHFEFKHVHAITGTFVLVVLGVLIAALVFAGRSQRWFIGNANLRIVFPEEGAAGIRQGSEVYFLGTLVGTVSDVSVDLSGRMAAEVNIRRDFFRFVRTDSSAVIKKKFGVVGDAYFELTRGQGQPLPEKNAAIVCGEQLPGALESAIEEVRREAVPALKKLSAGLGVWTTLGSNLMTSQERLDGVIGRTEDLLASVQQGKGTAGRLLTDPAAADELQRLLSKANMSAEALQPILENLRTASDELRVASTNLPTISGALSKGAGDLPELILQTRISMREMERLIGAMQRHWLVRKYVNRTNPPPLRPLPASDKPQKKRVEQLRSPKVSAR